jgi:hypothetical protein
MSAVSENEFAFTGDDEPPLHATETEASSDAYRKQRSVVIELLVCSHATRESMRQIDAWCVLIQGNPNLTISRKNKPRVRQ